MKRLGALGRAAILLLPLPFLGLFAAGVRIPVPRTILKAATRTQNGAPLPTELDEAERRARESGEPTLFVDSGPSGTLDGLLALSFDLDTSDSLSPYAARLAFSPAARGARRIAVRRGDSVMAELPGTALPEDLVLVLSMERRGPTTLDLTIEYEDRTVEGEALLPGSPGRDGAEVLLVTGRPGTSWIERLYRTRRIPVEELGTIDLGSYRLVVLDDLPLDMLDEGVSAELARRVESKTLSLLVAFGSPFSALKGATPPLEAILPIELEPRSLEFLPDLALVLAIDASGSMAGEKLSIAKVSGTELLAGLKKGDLLSVLAFWDEHEVLVPFARTDRMPPDLGLRDLRSRGGTDLFPALAAAVEALQALPPDRERHIVLASDGITKKGDEEGFYAAATAAGVTVSVFGIGEEKDEELLRRIADTCGGRYYPVADPATIPALVFEDRRRVPRRLWTDGNFEVQGPTGRPVATILGMTLGGLAHGAEAAWTDQWGDPLLAFSIGAGAGTVAFASDFRGVATADLLRLGEAARTFKTILDPLVSERPLRGASMEYGRGLSLSVEAIALAEPVATLLAADGTELQRRPMARGPLGWWTAEFAPPSPGRYRAAVYEGGALASEAELVYSGISGGEAAGARERAAALAAAPTYVDGALVFLFLAAAAAAASSYLLRRLS